MNMSTLKLSNTCISLYSAFINKQNAHQDNIYNVSVIYHHLQGGRGQFHLKNSTSHMVHKMVAIKNLVVHHKIVMYDFKITVYNKLYTAVM